MSNQNQYRERAAEAVAPYFVGMNNSYVVDARYMPLIDAIASLCEQVAAESAPQIESICMKCHRSITHMQVPHYHGPGSEVTAIKFAHTCAGEGE